MIAFLRLGQTSDDSRRGHKASLGAARTKSKLVLRMMNGKQAGARERR